MVIAIGSSIATIIAVTGITTGGIAGTAGRAASGTLATITSIAIPTGVDDEPASRAQRQD